MTILKRVFLLGVLGSGLTGWAALRGDLEALIQAQGGNRTTARDGDTRAVKWINQQALKIRGWVPGQHTFEPDIDFSVKSYKADFEKYMAGGVLPDHPEAKKWKKFTDGAIAYQESLRGKKGVNFTLHKKGSDPKRQNEILVVSAHYDTITHNHETFEVTPDRPAPGADDNGAAVVALLQVARELNDLKPKIAVEIVFFDFEEAFFLGSRAYAENLRGRGYEVARLVNLEMIGWDKPEAGRVKIYARSAGRPGADVDMVLAHKAYGELAKAGLKPEILRNNFDRSDNWSFWNAAHGAITISEDWERNFNEQHYHTPSDTPETLDWAFVEKIKSATVRLVRELSTK